MIVVAVGVVGTVGAFVLGPFVVELVYDADLSGRTLAMLALGSACYMVALAIAQAVIALHGHALVALGWVIGVVAFVLATWLAGDDLFRRVEIGLLASASRRWSRSGWRCAAKLATGVVPAGASMIEAITDMPLET